MIDLNDREAVKEASRFNRRLRLRRRDPATGQAMTIAAAKKVSFTVAKGLKDKL